MAKPRSTSEFRARPDKASIEKAAYWLARQDARQLSGKEQVAFDRWLGQSADNARAYRRVASAWTMFDGAVSGPAELHQLRSAALAARPVPSRVRTAAVLGAVSGLAFAGWLLVSSLAPSLQVGPHDADGRPVEQSYATTATKRAVFRLQDGSKATLNADTRMSIVFGSNRRLVRIDHGQAFFDVAKDPRRPFVVQAGLRQVTAIGTAFEVLQTSDRLVVTLAHGTIRIDRTAASSSPVRAINTTRDTAIFMTPGHRLSVVAGEPDRVTAVDLVKALAWRVGRIEFDNEPLRDVVAEISRYSNRPIILANERVGALRLSGVMQTDAPEHFLRALPVLLPVVVEHSLSSDRIEIREIGGK